MCSSLTESCRCFCSLSLSRWTGRGPGRARRTAWYYVHSSHSRKSISPCQLSPYILSPHNYQLNLGFSVFWLNYFFLNFSRNSFLSFWCSDWLYGLFCWTWSTLRSMQWKDLKQSSFRWSHWFIFWLLALQWHRHFSNSCP